MVANLAAVSTGGPIWSFFLWQQRIKRGISAAKRNEGHKPASCPSLLLYKNYPGCGDQLLVLDRQRWEHTPPLPLAPFSTLVFSSSSASLSRGEKNSRSRPVSSQWTTFQLLVLLFHLCPHIPDPWKRRKKKA